MTSKVAAVFLINKHNQILLYLRDDKSSIPYPNMWAVLGGHIENGESIIQGLKREIREEIIDKRTSKGYELKSPQYIGRLNDLVGNEVYIYKEKIERTLDELILTEGQKLGYFSYDEAICLRIPAPLEEFLKENKKEIFVESTKQL